MRKNYLFVATHFGSGATVLARILNSNNQIAFPPYTNIEYNNYSSLNELNKNIQRNKNLRSFRTLYCDKICIDANINYQKFDKSVKFILFTRSPEGTIKHLVNEKNYSMQSAKEYYFFRMRRIMEMANKLQDYIFITYDDLIKENCFVKIEKYLDLTEPLSRYFYLIDDNDKKDINLKEEEIIKNPIEPDLYIPNLENLNKKYFNYLERIKQVSKIL